jgi:hypothetical protein
VRDFLREDVLFKAAKLALVATLAVAPSIVDSYFFNPGYRSILLERAAESLLPALFARDLILVFLSLLMSSACGFAWADGKKVIGFETFDRFRKELKTLVWLGPVLAAGTALLLDITLLRHFRGLYPDNPLVSLSIPLRAAFFEEVICRFGILMIVFRLTRSVTTAVVVSALFNTLLGLRSADFVGFPLGFDWLTGRILISRMMLASFLGYFYCRKGLMSTISLRFMMELKHVVLPLLIPR